MQRITRQDHHHRHHHHHQINYGHHYHRTHNHPPQSILKHDTSYPFSNFSSMTLLRIIKRGGTEWKGNILNFPQDLANNPCSKGETVSSKQNPYWCGVSTNLGLVTCSVLGSPTMLYGDYLAAVRAFRSEPYWYDF